MTVGEILEKSEYKIENIDTTRVPCICAVRRASMIHKGVNIGIISEEANDAGEFSWVIKLDWERLEDFPYINIPDVDMSIKKKEYIISNIIPTFVKQRIYADEGPDLYEKLYQLGLKSKDAFEIMCRTNGELGHDDIFIQRLT